MREWLRRVSMLMRGGRVDADVAEEIEFHQAMRARSLEADGLSPAEARQQAAREVGRPLEIRERARDAWAFAWLDRVRQDVRHAARALRRQPGFSAAVVATLALGIGANTAMFSVVDALLLRHAPFADPERLVLLVASRPSQQEPRLPLSFPNFADVRSRARSLSGLAAWTIGEMTVTGDGDPELAQNTYVTSNLFDVLGVRPALGRTFRADEDRRGTAPVVVLSHAFWQRRFGGDPAIIGRRIRLDGAAYDIVGILPATFSFAGYPHRTDLWLPLGLDPFEGLQYARGLNQMGAVGRLAPGVSIAAAEQEIAVLAKDLERESPDVNGGRAMVVLPLEQQGSASVRLAIVILTWGVGLVLAVACANVTNLLLTRASARRDELALRAMLGGSRRRIAGQLLAEYLVLALVGGACGLVVAGLLHQVLARLPYQTPDYFTPWMPALADHAFDWRLLAFACVVSLGIGLVVGIFPALQGSRSELDGLSSGVRVSAGRRAMRVRSTIVVVETALAVVLLTGTALMMTSVSRLLSVDPGFRTTGVVTIDLTLPSSRYQTMAEVSAFYEEYLQRLRAVTGVQSAGAAEFIPFSGLDGSTGILIGGEPIPDSAQRPRLHYRSVTAGYFDALGMSLRGGRLVGAEDRAGGALVALINERAAAMLFGGGPAIGRRVALDFEAMRFFPDRPPVFDLALGLRDVVGVVGDVRHHGLAEAPDPELYVPASQRPVRRMTVVVRSTADPAATIAAATATLRAMDPEQPMAGVSTLPALAGASIAVPRFNRTLMVGFGTLAAVLSAIGIYGVMSYVVALRRRDIGVHVAVGATPRDIFNLIARQVARLGLLGIVIGVGAVIGVGPLVGTLLFGVTPRDPAVLASVVAAVALVVCGAATVPVIRALRIDAAQALRGE